MFNRKPNWRAGIVGLASLALLATFPLATVTASAEPVEPPPTPASTVEHATTVKTSESPAAKKVAVKDAVESLAKKAASSEGASVERAASGYDAFRMAGQDRSSEMDGLVSLKNRPNDGAWMVGQHGELRQIKTVSTDPLKRVMVTHDFPLGEFCWLSPNGHGSGEYVTNQNGYSARPWFKKPFGSFPGKFDGFAQNENYVYLTATKELDNDSNVNWGATVVRFDKTNNSWQYNARGSWSDISWRKSSYNNQEVSINQPPNFNPPQPSGVCIQPSTRLDFEANGRGNTFSRFAGNVTSGVLLKDGTYVFGGVAEKPKPAGGQFTARNKMFALKPGGQVVYLGYFDIAQSKAFSLDGNYVLSENGDIYASYGTVNNDGYMSGSYKVSIDKISANDIQNRIKNPVAVYDTSVSQWRSNGQGKTIGSTNVMRERKFAARGRTQMFGAFDISPDGNFVIFGTEEAVDLHGSITQNETGTITEYDINTGRPIRNIESYRATESQKQSWLRGHGSKMPQVTDGSGALIPPPDRDFTLSKQVVNRIGDDQFKVDLNPLNPFSNIAKYTIPEQTTSFTQSKQTMQIREKISISGLSFKARIAERADGNAKLTNYNTTLECSENVKVGEVNNRSGNRYFDIEVPASVQSPIACKLVNKGPAPKRTFEFEKNLTRALSNDSFTVYMEPATSGIIQTRPTTVSGRDGVFNIPTFRGSKKQEISNGDIRVNFIEQATKGSLDNYKTSLSCVDNNGALTLSNRVPYVNGNTWRLAATIPNSAEGDIVCTLRNAGTAPQPKDKTVTLYKKFDRRYKNSDNFKVFAEVPLSYPINKAEGQTNNTINPNASATTPLSSKVFKNNATITVGELGVGQTNLNNYDRDIKCTEGGFNGTPLPVAANVGNSKQFNLSSTTSSTVDCYVINTSHTPPSQPPSKVTVNLYKKFDARYADNDNFTVSVVDDFNRADVLTGSTTGTGTENAVTDIPLGSAEFKSNAYLHFTETGIDGADMNNYKVAVTCTEGGRTGKAISGYSSGAVTYNDYFDLSNTNSGVVDCFVDNTVKKTPPPTDTTLIVEKHLVSRVKPGDNFKITTTVTHAGKAEQSVVATHDSDADGSYKSVAVQSISAGDSVSVQEAGINANLSEYDSGMSCVINDDPASRQEKLSAEDVAVTRTSGGFRFSAPQNIGGKYIHCVLTNTAKHKATPPVPRPGTLTVYKKMLKNNSGDKFSLLVKSEEPTLFYGTAGWTAKTLDVPDTPNFSNPNVLGTMLVHSKPYRFGADIEIYETSSVFANYNVTLKCKVGTEPFKNVRLTKSNGTFSARLSTTKQGNPGYICVLSNKGKNPPDYNNGILRFKKVSDSDQGLLLPGSEWRLFKKNEFSSWEPVNAHLVDNDSKGDFSDQDNRAGWIKVTGLQTKLPGSNDPVEYKLVETKAPDGYQITGNGEYKFTLSPQNREISEGSAIVITNEKPKGSITIHKVSKTGNDLSGSAWKICKQDKPTECYTVADNVVTGVGSNGKLGKVADVDKRSAYIKIQDISLGVYTIKEIKAPVGFMLKTELVVTELLTADNPDWVGVIENEQASVPELPFTGGWGTLPYMILGFVLTGGAVVAFVIARPKKTRPSQK